MAEPPSAAQAPPEPPREQTDREKNVASQRRIVEAINRKKGDRPIVCAVCGTAEWQLGEGYVNLSLSPRPTDTVLGGARYPTVAIICKHCGHTLLINVYGLGFTPEDVAAMPLRPPTRA